MNDLIIGYYGAAFFGGGTYIKLSKKEIEDFKIERIHSAVPNYIPNGEKYIKIHDKISFKEKEGFHFIEDDDPRLISIYIKGNLKINKLIDLVKNINLEKMSKTEYNDEEVLDGLCWSFFIKLDNKTYKIEGYEDMPKKLEEVIKYMESIADDAEMEKHINK